MDFPFDFPILVTGKTIGQPKTVTTIEDCTAVIEQDHYDPDNWTIWEILVDGSPLPDRHWLRQPMLLHLTTPEMMRQIDRAWNEHWADALWEPREFVQ